MKNLFLLFVLTTFQFSLFAQNATTSNSTSGNNRQLMAYNNTKASIPNKKTKTNHSTQPNKTSNIATQDDSCLENNSTKRNSENWEMITETPEDSNLSSIKNEAEFTLDWPCSVNN